MSLHHAAERKSLENSTVVKFRTDRPAWIVAIAVVVFVAQSVSVCASPSRCTAFDSAPRELAATTGCCALEPARSCPSASATPVLTRLAAWDDSVVVGPPQALASTWIARDDSAPRRPAFRSLSPGRQISLPLLI